MPTRAVFRCQFCDAVPDHGTQRSLQGQVTERMFGEYLDAFPGRWLVWNGGGPLGPRRYACRKHRGDLVAYLRYHYATVASQVWKMPPYTQRWPDEKRPHMGGSMGIIKFGLRGGLLQDAPPAKPDPPTPPAPPPAHAPAAAESAPSAAESASPPAESAPPPAAPAPLEEDFPIEEMFPPGELFLPEDMFPAFGDEPPPPGSGQWPDAEPPGSGWPDAEPPPPGSGQWPDAEPPPPGSGQWPDAEPPPPGSGQWPDAEEPPPAP